MSSKPAARACVNFLRHSVRVAERERVTERQSQGGREREREREREFPPTAPRGGPVENLRKIETNGEIVNLSILICQFKPPKVNALKKLVVKGIGRGRPVERPWGICGEFGPVENLWRIRLI